MYKEKIIIIGAGISGISAAVYLAKKGYSVEIFETKNLIGGRMYSFANQSMNEIVDNGQHLLMSAYKNFLALLEELGTIKKIKTQETLDIKFYSKNGNYSRLSTYPFSGKIGLLYSLLKMNNLTFSDKINVINFFISLIILKNKKQNKTVAEYLKSKHQKENIIEKFWQPLCLAVLNLSSELADADLFIQVLKKAFISNQDSSKLIFPAVNLSDLISPFGDWFEKHNGKIHFNSRIDNILINNNKVDSVFVNGEKHIADYYISTVQPYILKKLIANNNENVLSSKLEEYEYSTIISIYIWLDSEIIDEDFVALLGTETQWIFNLNKITKRASTNNYLYALTISNADELNLMSNIEIMNLCWSELVSIFPIAKKIKVLDYLVIKNKRATFKANPSIASKRLNSYIGMSNLFIAGDWTNTNLPATIESACISGINASNMIAAKQMK